MKADDCQSSTRRKKLQRSIQPLLDLPQLIVDEHAQRLESTGRWMFAGLARTYRLGNNRSKLARAHDGTLLPLLDNCASNTSSEALFSQCCNHFANLVDARPSEPG